ncbi:MAG: S-adenosylmethionine:tRNA ribosyltransferase-isomerase, partial [Candidatus Zixiibacteriota bacterium]
MELSLFDYSLPSELIAQFPMRKREQSRLLVLDRDTGEIQHRSFKDLIEFLTPGDALVVNNTKVFKARLIGRR